MGESVASGAGLEVSVSFGRFENDSLSWEKWSSFSPNKHLEEVGKFSTPGSVAKKKAFFEAHYKKIAARKAELLLDQEMQLRSDDPSCSDDSGNTYEANEEFGAISNGQISPKGIEFDTDSSQNSISEETVTEHNVSNSQDISQGIEEDTNSTSINHMAHVDSGNKFVVSIDQGSCQSVEQDSDLIRVVDTIQAGAINEQDTNSTSINHMAHVDNGNKFVVSSDQGSCQSVEQDSDLIRVVDTIHAGAINEKATIFEELQSSEIEGAAAEVNGILDRFEEKPPEKDIMVQGDTHIREPRDAVKPPPKLDAGRGRTPIIKEQKRKVDPSIKSQKITPIKKEKNLTGAKKKLATPLPKSPIIATPRISKPAASSTLMFTSQSSTKKSNSSSLSRTNRSAGESKRVTPISLHMSLSLEPAISDSTPQTTARKSFIMESMGDKDIVKRAFKTFQNNFNHLRSSTDERFSGTNQVLTKGTEKKLSTSTAPRKENDGTRKSTTKMNAATDQLGARRNFTSSGSYKQDGENKSTAKAAPSSFGMRSDERADKRKELSKKSEEKTSAKVAERSRLSSKSKEGKDDGVKKVRQNPNFKATPMPGFYRGQGKEGHGIIPETRT